MIIVNTPYDSGPESPVPRRPRLSVLSIGGSYVFGGLIPLAPYMALHSVLMGLSISVGITLLALLAFGYIKGHFIGINPLRAGLQTVLTGGLAAGAAFLIAKLVS